MIRFIQRLYLKLLIMYYGKYKDRSFKCSSCSKRFIYNTHFYISCSRKLLYEMEARVEHNRRLKEINIINQFDIDYNNYIKSQIQKYK